MELDQQSKHESDTSSMADEREIHLKLNQILTILDDINGQKDAEPLPEEKFSQSLFEDVFN